MVVSSTRKQVSLIGSVVSLLLTTVAFFLLRGKQEFLGYFFLAGIAIEFTLFWLFLFEKYMVAQQFAISSLWLLFTVYGVSQGEITMIMITGFLILSIIAGYGFYLKGVILIMIANSLVIILTGWMSKVGLAPYKVDNLDPAALIFPQHFIHFCWGRLSDGHIGYAG